MPMDQGNGVGVSDFMSDEICNFNDDSCSNENEIDIDSSIKLGADTENLKNESFSKSNDVYVTRSGRLSRPVVQF